MKKLLTIGIGVMAAAALVLLGPTLLELYRLERFVSQTSEAAQADAGPWPRLVDVCTGCHGDRGSSQDSFYPSLAGQPALYLATQLRHFASGQRANPNMGPLAMTLSDSEIKELSEYFARQPIVKSDSFKLDPASSDKGRQLVTSGACLACHGEHLMGHDEMPRLAGEGSDYLLRQFDEFASGRRIEATGTMRVLSTSASIEDRTAMANYLASLTPQGK